MKPSKLLLAAVALGCLSCSRSHAEGWCPTTAPNTNWSAVASSADGSRLFAAAGAIYAVPMGPLPNFNSPIYLSTNGGNSWLMTPAPFATWSAIGCSADGSTAVAAIWTSQGVASGIYFSRDFGATWTPSDAPAKQWQSLAGSADGSKWVAVAGGIIATSSDFGATWTPTAAPPEQWAATASSADSTTLYAAEVSYTDMRIKGLIYCSTNAGNTWNPTAAPALEWRSLACSADGTQILAGPAQDLSFDAAPLCLSTDRGATWTTNSNARAFWSAVASSADGSRLAALANYAVWTSSDYGNTWVSNAVPATLWPAVASSADGCKLIAAAEDAGVGVGHIYRLEATPSPCLRLAPAGSNVSVTCIVPSQNLLLQQSTDLAGQWMDVTCERTLRPADVTFQWTVPATNSACFFRLAQP